MVADYIQLLNNVEDKDKHLVEKMFFTNLFYHYIKSSKGKFALDLFEYKDRLIIPSYIKDGVEWLLQ